jgi:hypothetical protein
MLPASKRFFPLHYDTPIIIYYLYLSAKFTHLYLLFVFIYQVNIKATAPIYVTSCTCSKSTILLDRRILHSHGKSHVG